MPSTYVRRKIGIYVHNITPRPLSRTRRTPINLPKSVLEHCVITDLKHTIGGSAKVLLLSISPIPQGVSRQLSPSPLTVCLVPLRCKIGAQKRNNNN